MVEVGNRKKRKMTLDFKHLNACVVVEKMVKCADVFTENLRTGVMDKLGFSYETVQKWNPKLIYAPNSGLGAKGE